jgi:hypothetical protein
MSTLGTPKPDCQARERSASERRSALGSLASGRGDGVTMANGEETAYGGFSLSYTKALPHDTNGNVHAPSYQAMVSALTMNDGGALESLPVGSNRSATSASAATDINPRQYTTIQGESNPRGYRKLTSPLTGHAYDTEGADAGSLGISAVPLIKSDEFAAEMSELYGMALLRDMPFTDIADGVGAAVQVTTELSGMPFFQTNYPTNDMATRRRYNTRGTITNSADLFRGSTDGSKIGHWMSQYLLVGSDTRSKDVQGSSPSQNPSYRGVNADVRHAHGFIYMGTQVIDQRCTVAKPGADYLTTWASWLDAQNGVDFNNLDTFNRRRRYLTTPRDIATYVHFDALYQAYHVACLLMLHPVHPIAGARGFQFDRGMPESRSRTRSAFASFGGPHILTLVTEVATRALKAVWRQKWMHHRRLRPEVAAALITLHANAPTLIADIELRDAIGTLAAKTPQPLLAQIATHNQGQTNNDKILDSVSTGLPTIAANKNFLLPMAFPEGSPTHPAYGAGHATVAGACVTTLKAFFEMFDDSGKELMWPLQLYVPDWQQGTGASGNEEEGGELVPLADGNIYVPDAIAANPSASQRRELVTIQGELNKLAMNISNARNIAGVHYYTDYYESIRLGERIAVSILEEHLSLYEEPVSMSFTSFDGEQIRIASNGGTSRVIVDGSTSADWYDRYAS